jgi:hypothetical protein
VVQSTVPANAFDPNWIDAILAEILTGGNDRVSILDEVVEELIALAP